MTQTMSWQLIGFGIVQLVALVGAYYGLKADNRELKAELHLMMANERADRLSVVAATKADLITLIGKVETYINDLTHRVATLESGQDEWTKSLRERTHELANDVHTLVLKVDRLERPKQHGKES
jgi:hypothetical protein